METYVAFRAWCFLLSIPFQSLFATIRILTFHCNHPEFLEYQCQSLEKFLLDDYELIVINDGINELESTAIQAMCEKYNAKNIRYEQSWHKSDSLNEQIAQSLRAPQGNDFFCFPKIDVQQISENCSVRHCHLIQYALDHFGYEHNDIVVIMDGDVFAIQPLCIRDLLSTFPIIGIDSEFRDKHYLWVTFIAFDPARLPNLRDLRFHVDLIDGLVCDTGSHSYHYFKNNPNVRYQFFPRCHSSDFFPYDEFTFSKFGLEALKKCPIDWSINAMEFYVDYHFIHFCGGAGLHPVKKFQDIAHIMKSVLAQEVIPNNINNLQFSLREGKS